MPADVAAFEKENKLTLPADYAKFLASLSKAERYKDSRGVEVHLFPLTGKEESLTAPTELDEHTVPFFKMLQPHLKMWSEFTGQKEFDNLSGPNLKAKEINAAVCIGEDDNGDLIFLSRGKVCTFAHDGCQVEEVAESFGAYLKSCTRK